MMSNLQLELLRLYGNGVSEETLREVKSVLAKYFADHAASEMDSVWDEKNLTEQDMLDGQMNTTAPRIVLDTNILIASIGKKSPFRYCRKQSLMYLQ